jgi:hypothetical protein
MHHHVSNMFYMCVEMRGVCGCARSERPTKALVDVSMQGVSAHPPHKGVHYEPGTHNVSLQCHVSMHGCLLNLSIGYSMGQASTK